MQISWNKNKLCLRDERLPGGELVIWYIEAFCRKGSTSRPWEETVIPHQTELVSTNSDQTEILLEMVVGAEVTVRHVIRVDADGVGFRLGIANSGDQPVDVEWAQPCIQVAEYTGHGQADYIGRCFLFTDKGLVTLDETRRTEEALYRGGQVYVPEGVDLQDVNPRPISPDRPVKGLIGCYASDGSSLLATAWSSTQELFQGVITCIHSDFRIGGLAPGETKKIHGKVYLLENDVQGLLERYAVDFPHGL